MYIFWESKTNKIELSILETVREEFRVLIYEFKKNCLTKLKVGNFLRKNLIL